MRVSSTPPSAPGGANASVRTSSTSRSESKPLELQADRFEPIEARDDPQYVLPKQDRIAITRRGDPHEMHYHGVCFPDGRQLTGWHLLDGSAERAGLGHLAPYASYDVACLFAHAMKRGLPLSDEERKCLTTDVPFGGIDGSLLASLPRKELEQALDTMVDTQLVEHWLYVGQIGKGLTAPFRDTASPLVKRNLNPELFSVDEMRSGVSLEVYARAKDAVPGTPAHAKVWEELRVRFVRGLVSELANATQDGGGRVDLVSAEKVFFGEAGRVFRAAVARARTTWLEHPDSTTLAIANLRDAVVRPSEETKGIFGKLEEGIRARLARPQHGLAAFHMRNAKPSEGDRLLEALTARLPAGAAVKRELRLPIAIALDTLFTEHTRGGTVDLQSLNRAVGRTGVDLAIALARGLGPTRAAEDPFDGGLWTKLIEPLHALEPTAARDIVFGDRLSPPPTKLSQLSELLYAGDLPYLSEIANAVRLRSFDAPGLYDRDPKARRDAIRFLDGVAKRLDELAVSETGDRSVMGSVLLDTFAPFVDRSGILDVEQVYEREGDYAGRLAAILAWTAHARVDKGLQSKTGTLPGTTPLEPKTLAAIGRGLGDTAQRSRMPALGAVAAAFRRQKQAPPLQGFSAVVLQHLFPTTTGLIEALVENGLSKSKLSIVGKSYSTSDKTFAALEGAGFDVDARSRPTRTVGTDASATLKSIAKDRLQELFEDVRPEELASQSPRRRFLLVDEGANLISALLEHFPKYAKLCVAVEHTERGMQLVDAYRKENGELPMPLVDMARSASKKDLESPLIGESVVHSAEGELAQLGWKPKLRQATVLGYGAVGSQVASALERRGFRVHIFDPDPAARARARADGHKAPEGDGARAAALAQGHVIFSCTGRTSIEPRELRDLVPNGAVLVNAGSGTHELGMSQLGEQELAQRVAPEGLSEKGKAVVPFRGKVLEVGAYHAPDEHRHLVLRDTKTAPNGNKLEVEHLVLRGGAVVNMTRDIPPEYVQLTRGLVLASALQATRETRPGVRSLDTNLERTLVSAVRNDLTSKGLPDLKTPDFSKCADWE